MIEDGRNLLGQNLTTDVCIVGSGQAGITLAWYLLQQGLSVVVLEGSRSTNPGGPNAPIDGHPYWYNENELLYNGVADGQFTGNEPKFLIRPSHDFRGGAQERERIYGGTSTHWGGQSRPLDPITFEERPGFPGWPITRADLDPFYAEACTFLDLYGDYYGPDGTAGYNFTAEFWAQELGQSVAQMDGFDVDMYQFVPGANLQFQARQVDGQTIGESAARVILNASLLDIDHQSGSVTQLTVGAMEEAGATQAGTFTVGARAYVLACGAVANARQLLLSDVGNEHDLVGRYLMGHPIASGANAVTTSSSYLTASERALLSYQNPNQAPGAKHQYPISLLAGLLTPDAKATLALGTGRCWFGTGGTSHFYHGLLPEADSRITLSDQTDPVFGQPQTRATWVLAPGEQSNYEKLTGLFEQAVTAKGGGPVAIEPWSAVEPLMVFNGHHLGTTRMAAAPEDGVVDANLKVHSMDNLYVAGSSVWASAGISNPTFSIVAFSIRLADHLTGLLGGTAPTRG